MKSSTIRNGTRHFWSFQSIWSTSGWSSVAHCPTRKTRESFHAFRPVVQILHTRAVQSVRSARNVTPLHLDPLYISLLVLVVLTNHQLGEGVIPSYRMKVIPPTLPVSNTTQLRGSDFTLRQQQGSATNALPNQLICSDTMTSLPQRTTNKTRLFVTAHLGAGTLVSLVEFLAARYPFFHSNLRTEP